MQKLNVTSEAARFRTHAPSFLHSAEKRVYFLWGYRDYFTKSTIIKNKKPAQYGRDNKLSQEPELTEAL